MIGTCNTLTHVFHPHKNKPKSHLLSFCLLMSNVCHTHTHNFLFAKQLKIAVRHGSDLIGITRTMSCWNVSSKLFWKRIRSSRAKRNSSCVRHKCYASAQRKRRSPILQTFVKRCTDNRSICWTSCWRNWVRAVRWMATSNWSSKAVSKPNKSKTYYEGKRSTKLHFSSCPKVNFHFFISRFTNV